MTAVVVVLVKDVHNLPMAMDQGVEPGMALITLFLTVLPLLSALRNMMVLIGGV